MSSSGLIRRKGDVASLIAHTALPPRTVVVLPSPEFRPLLNKGCAIVRLTAGASRDRHSADNLVFAFVARASQLQIFVPANVIMR